VIDGAAEHPTPLVESVAMGSIAAPMPEAVPQLPDGLDRQGLLSAAQAETLIYAAALMRAIFPVGSSRRTRAVRSRHRPKVRRLPQGYFLGDGTGAGKGRQVASVILDRWVRGERRHIWISKNEALLEDARRDWAALGGLPIDIQPLASWKLGTPIAMRDGILFVTYPTLRSGRNDATRLDQILAWAGEDFDGVIVFDEAHAMANAAGGEGSRGKVKGSEQASPGCACRTSCPGPGCSTPRQPVHPTSTTSPMPRALVSGVRRPPSPTARPSSPIFAMAESPRWNWSRGISNRSASTPPARFPSPVSNMRSSSIA
jgi:hypothetical protein